uniref:Uncharacterized protein LOC104233089 n=1 Tax=Nicotiana sylvestris TaxID=4096 RepID=A0A1U7WXP7_NICSY|nr:PREDICTED: uncharacterized protein LOC104233089 [Nicotiana sylvestris]
METDEDVTYCIGAGWMRRRLASEVLCDKSMPPGHKGKLYRMVVRPAMLKDRIKNEVIKDKVEVASTEDKLRESRLRWFGHVKRRDIDAPVNRCERLSIAGLTKGRWNLDRGRVKYSAAALFHRGQWYLFYPKVPPLNLTSVSSIIVAASAVNLPWPHYFIFVSAFSSALNLYRFNSFIRWL